MRARLQKSIPGAGLSIGEDTILRPTLALVFSFIYVALSLNIPIRRTGSHRDACPGSYSLKSNQTITALHPTNS